MKKKVIAIIGAGGRIGSSLVHKLSAEQHELLLVDINYKKIKYLKKINKLSKVEIFCGDITKTSVINKFLKFGIKKFKRIDSAVYCSYAKSKKFGSPLNNIDEKFLKEDLYKQLGAVILFSIKIIEIFLKFKKGNLILLSSIMGVKAPKFDHYLNTKMVSPIEYSAVKSGIISITSYLSKYYKNNNIRVNCVSPGGIKDNQPKNFQIKYKKSCNNKGLLDPKDVSSVISFLLSSDSEFINGQNIIIDDGWSL
jgi:NAD(P)-dependent dehydrogenase (short-subunit alcohol dehydrogenase family)